jgi:hypothetical protein
VTSRIHKARIPVDAGERIVFSEDQWKRIERAYGHKLPKAIRAGILLATEALRLIGGMERTAPALEKMIAKTKSLKDAARSLLKEVGWPVKEDAAWKSFEAMTEGAATAVKEFPNVHLQFLMVVDSLFAGCNLMLRNWESDGGLREGWAWDAWVQSISEVMQHHGLPGAARKDFRKRKANQVESQFVRLIDKLQEHMPEELRRHTQSLDSLAQAIYRARKSNWWPELLPPNIRKEFESFLESPEEQAAGHQKFRQKPSMDPNNFVERHPGLFVRAEIIALEEHEEEGQDQEKVEPKSQDG